MIKVMFQKIRLWNNWCDHSSKTKAGVRGKPPFRLRNGLMIYLSHFRKIFFREHTIGRPE
jgi:hypothetical protein